MVLDPSLGGPLYQLSYEKASLVPHSTCYSASLKTDKVKGGESRVQGRQISGSYAILKSSSYLASCGEGKFFCSHDALLNQRKMMKNVAPQLRSIATFSSTESSSCFMLASQFHSKTKSNQT